VDRRLASNLDVRRSAACTCARLAHAVMRSSDGGRRGLKAQKTEPFMVPEEVIS
jgi:hypothetical protein